MSNDTSSYTTKPKSAFSNSWAIPAVILLIVCLIIALLVMNKPEPKKRGPSSNPGILVDTLLIEPEQYKPNIKSYGLVQPRTRSKLVAQVSGRVDYMSERFRDGGFFKKDDLLLQLEATDYEIALHVAEANLADAEKALQEEIAEAEQAAANWKLLGRKSAASALTLREPQLKAARARVKSQKALLKQAQINLARTEIRAPFDGRVLETNIDLGQVASNNSILGEVYATDTIEIRLPVKNSELPMLNLPETYSHIHETSSEQSYPQAMIYSSLAGAETWEGKIIRTSGSIDNSSRQLYVFARIDDPFGKKAEGRFPLKIGQYVTAEIEGKSLEGVIKVPNKAIYQGAYVYLFKDGAVYRQDVEIGWQNSDIAIIETGLSLGDEVVVSPMGQVASGTLARSKESQQAPKKQDQEKQQPKLARKSSAKNNQ